MKNKEFMLRAWALVLVLVMAFSVILTGCGGGTEQTSESSQASGNSSGTGSKEESGSSKDPTSNSSGIPSGKESPSSKGDSVNSRPVISSPSENSTSQIPDGDKMYSITVKTEGGMALSDVKVTLKDAQGKEVLSVNTDENGKAFGVLKAGEYAVSLSNLRPGFSAPDEEVKTSADDSELTVKVKTAVITEEAPSSHKAYKVGDVLYDFSFVSEGQEMKLSEILQSKKLVVLNFWATWCGPCKSEFPAVQKAYSEYGDSVEIIAVSISDNYSACSAFKKENGYTFNMIPEFGIYQKFQAFSAGQIPFTILIDRYGMFVDFFVGSNDSESEWKKIFDGYTSDKYQQNPGQPVENSSDDEQSSSSEIVLPDVTMPETAEIEAAINGEGFTGSYIAPSAETVWPWILSEDGKSITPGNIGKHSTMATISTEVDFKKGDILAFDYIASIEKDVMSVYEYDLFSVYIDGYLAIKINGSHPVWETCYAYTPISAGKHTVTLYFGKDSDDWYLPNNEEYVNVRNIRMVTEEEMTKNGGSLLVYRNAATDINKSQNPTTSYLNYANVVLNREDGYYHVNSEDGPILLCSLMNGTAWSPTAINALSAAGLLIFDLTDYSNIVDSYSWQEMHSEIGYCPVNVQLADMLDLIVSSIGNGPNHENEWLELCGYFEHYGVGEGITNVLDVMKGISVQSAFPAKEGKNHVVMNQVLVPRGLYYEFVPKESGVYRFYSVDNGPTEDEHIDTYAWFILPDGSLRGNIVDENDDQSISNFNFSIYHRCIAGEKYYIAVAFNAPDALGEFDFVIEYISESYDEFIDCTRHYLSSIDGSELKVDIVHGLETALGTDGYYHQILSYNEDGTPVLDYGEHGYIYVNFYGLSIFTSYLIYDGNYVTLKDYIEMNGEIADFGFDFTNRVDKDGNSLSFIGNYQKEMEDYLALAITEGDEKGFVKADQRLVEILEKTLIFLYGEYCNGVLVENQWLMFCSYFLHC